MSEDWVPREAPAVPKGNAKKTIVIWVVLIVMFLAIYQMFDTSQRHELTGYSGWWIAGAVIGTLIFALVLVVFLWGGAARFNTSQASGLEALAAGRYDEAVDVFAKVARRYRTKPSYFAVATYNHGYTLLRAGDSAAAAGILLRAERTPNIGPNGVRKLAAIQLARCFAFGGDVEKATTWLEAARKRTAGGDPIYDRALFEAVEGVVLCRQGKLEEANRHYEACWHRFTAYLPINLMSEVWLLRAYAVSSTSGPRDAGAAEPYLRMLRGLPPGSLDWITKHWPELQRFELAA